MKFFPHLNGDVSFLDLEKLMFEGGVRKPGYGQKRRKLKIAPGPQNRDAGATGSSRDLPATGGSASFSSTAAQQGPQPNNHPVGPQGPPHRGDNYRERDRDTYRADDRYRGRDRGYDYGRGDYGGGGGRSGYNNAGYGAGAGDHHNWRDHHHQGGYNRGRDHQHRSDHLGQTGAGGASQTHHGGVMMGGNPSASPGRSKFELTAVVSMIPRQATPDDLYRYFSEKCGRVVDVKFVPGNATIACVQFAEQRAMDKAVSGLANPEVCGAPVKIRASLEIREEMNYKPRKQVLEEQQQASRNQQPRHSRKIRVTNIPQKTNQMEMQKLFQPFGDIEGVFVRDGTCDLTFRATQSATDATNAMDGFQYMGDFLRVTQASETPPTRAAVPPREGS